MENGTHFPFFPFSSLNASFSRYHPTFSSLGLLCSFSSSLPCSSVSHQAGKA